METNEEKIEKLEKEAIIHKRRAINEYIWGGMLAGCALCLWAILGEPEAKSLSESQLKFASGLTITDSTCAAVLLVCAIENHFAYKDDKQEIMSLKKE